MFTSQYGSRHSSNGQNNRNWNSSNGKNKPYWNANGNGDPIGFRLENLANILLSYLLVFLHF
jgi:hypothetical protein